MEISLLKRVGAGAVAAAFSCLTIIQVSAGIITGTTETKSETLARGITYTEARNSIADGNNIYTFSVAADPSALSDYKFVIGGEYGTRTTAGNMAGKLIADGEQVVAGINGDFFSFNTGIPMGLSVNSGELLESNAGDTPHDGYLFSTFGIKKDGSVILGQDPATKASFTVNSKTIQIDRINRTRESWAPIVLFTERFGKTTKTNKVTASDKEKPAGCEIVVEVNGVLKAGQPLSGKVKAIHNANNSTIEPGTVVISSEADTVSRLNGINVGDSITINAGFADEQWNDAEFAIGGAAILVNDGKAQYNNYFNDAVMTKKANRSAIGVKADGSLVMVSIEGASRTAPRNALTADQTADYMAKDMGCKYALLLDSGGSTTLVTVANKNVTCRNTPSDGAQRPVGNGIFLVKKTAANSNNEYLNFKTADSYGNKSISVFGDSITHGANAPDISKQSYMGIVKQAVNNAIGGGNYGFTSIEGQMWNSQGTYKEVHSLDSNSIQDSSSDWGVLQRDGKTLGTAYKAATRQGAALTFTVTDTSFKKFCVYYSAASGNGTFNVKDSGGSILGSVDASVGITGMGRSNYMDFPADGEITIEVTSSGKRVPISGVGYYMDPNNVVINKYANNGLSLSSMDDAVILQMCKAGTVLFSLGYNDCHLNGADSAANKNKFTQKVNTVIEGVKANGAKLIVNDFCWNLPNNNHYRTELKRLADECGGAYVDYQNVYGSQLLNTLKDGTHPNETGHALIAKELLRVMGLANKHDKQPEHVFDGNLLPKNDGNTIPGANNDGLIDIQYKADGTVSLVQKSKSSMTWPCVRTTVNGTVDLGKTPYFIYDIEASGFCNVMIHTNVGDFDLARYVNDSKGSSDTDLKGNQKGAVNLKTIFGSKVPADGKINIVSIDYYTIGAYGTITAYKAAAMSANQAAPATTTTLPASTSTSATIDTTTLTNPTDKTPTTTTALPISTSASSTVETTTLANPTDENITSNSKTSDTALDIKTTISETGASSPITGENTLPICAVVLLAAVSVVLIFKFKKNKSRLTEEIRY